MFVKIKNSQVDVFPYTTRDLKRANPNTSFPNEISEETMALFDMYPVTTAEVPSYNKDTQMLTKSNPEMINNKWVLNWIINEKTPKQLAEDSAVIKHQINQERDRRISLNFEFEGKMYQRDPISAARIANAGNIAIGSIMQGATIGDYYWHNGDTPFVWISADNSVTQMDAHTVFRLSRAAMVKEEEIIFAAKELKNNDYIPSDFTDDKYWQ
jgi:hypothetical protein